MNKKIIKIKHLGVAWKSKIIFKRATAYISINKLVVEGCNLRKSQEIKSYLCEDESGEKIMVSYLEKKNI
jgi:hypothetical protein